MKRKEHEIYLSWFIINRVLKDFSDSIFYSGVIAKTNIGYISIQPLFDTMILKIHNFIWNENMLFVYACLGIESLRDFHAETIAGLKYTCLQQFHSSASELLLSSPLSRRIVTSWKASGNVGKESFTNQIAIVVPLSLWAVEEKCCLPRISKRFSVEIKDIKRFIASSISTNCIFSQIHNDRESITLFSLSPMIE